MYGSAAAIAASGRPAALHAIAVQGAIRGFEDAHVVLVEALAGRPALLARAEVPLAGHPGGVAALLNSSPRVTSLAWSVFGVPPMMTVASPRRCE